MTTTSLVLTELAAIAVLLLVIRAVLLHACDPRRDAALLAYAGCHCYRPRHVYTGGTR